MNASTLTTIRQRRARRTRAKLHGTAARPRLSVFRSVKHISAQLIDDDAKRTLLTVSERSLKGDTGTKTERAQALGTHLAKLALAQKITTVVFDRGSAAYHGRVQALAEAARAAGLTF